MPIKKDDSFRSNINEDDSDHTKRKQSIASPTKKTPKKAETDDNLNVFNERDSLGLDPKTLLGIPPPEALIKKS